MFVLLCCENRIRCGWRGFKWFVYFMFEIFVVKIRLLNEVILLLFLRSFCNSIYMFFRGGKFSFLIVKVIDYYIFRGKGRFLWVWKGYEYKMWLWWKYCVFWRLEAGSKKGSRGWGGYIYCFDFYIFVVVFIFLG